MAGPVSVPGHRNTAPRLLAPAFLAVVGLVASGCPGRRRVIDGGATDAGQDACAPGCCWYLHEPDESGVWCGRSSVLPEVVCSACGPGEFCDALIRRCYPSGSCGGCDADAWCAPTGQCLEPTCSAMGTCEDRVPVQGGPYLSLGIFEPDPTEAEVASFEIDRFEVTNRRYRDCEEDSGCDPPAGPFWLGMPDGYATDPFFDDFPVVSVSVEQARVFCAWAGGRLPAPVEWQKAAVGGCELRGGPGCDDEDIPRFEWGEADQTCDRGNVAMTVDRPCVGMPAPAGSHPTGASIYGVEDLFGNVEELLASPPNPCRNGIVMEGDWVCVSDTSFGSVVHPEIDHAGMVAGYGYEGPSVAMGFRCAYDP